MPKRIPLETNYFVYNRNKSTSQVIDYAIRENKTVVDGSPLFDRNRLFNQNPFRVCVGNDFALPSMREYFESAEPSKSSVHFIREHNNPHKTSKHEGYVIGFTADTNLQSDIFLAVSHNKILKWPESIQCKGKAINCYLFGVNIWQISPDEDHLDPEDLLLCFLDVVDSERRKFEKLRARFSSESLSIGRRKRQPIPEEVRIMVWRRDEGRCVQCNSNENIEYDHIIPHSRGGSDTARNIQLLCMNCNRTKHDRI